MSKLRLLFVKEAQASYISHLDLLRTFQRAFPRTELDIKHSQGYHPHPIISIVLPLPVGQSSDCELLDFEVTQDTDGRGIAEKLNTGMPSGLRVLDCYPAARPVRELTYLRADVTLEYDNGVPENAAARLTELLGRQELIIQKRTKRKELADVDIAPMIKDFSFTETEGAITLYRDRGGRYRHGDGAGPESRLESAAAGKGGGAVPARPDAGLPAGAPPRRAGRRGTGFPVKTRCSPRPGAGTSKNAEKM